MPRLDRLSTLIARFSLTVTPAREAVANLGICRAGKDGAMRVSLTPHESGRLGLGCDAITARLDWGGASNPLLAALPERVEMTVETGSETASLLRVFAAEASEMRCGAGPVLDRLGEVIVIRLLRAEIARGAASPGLLAGLADPRLGRAIVAMHDAPERAWTVPDLAAEAALSPSRFAELFAGTVGRTPLAYLREWRMTLARQDLVRGDRVQAVAHRYGYASAEALTRAFRKIHGECPMRIRRSAA
ncbi:helix-turn-helix transcriptional regulator [Limibaculum sp. M0105]|uniref:Helix-turn-helix transcriptional regulator n=1 Tax=Thermohalobaculum xanthum TaxID=2753746 RepID=A0A8J7SJP4_9RHOB|nr:AraC family transcriptional regulator [Thermohalobaculum xanthum]MBK0401105.1 helix-turn-helix transcriptional regulator [Thermohalobaculum xanthum]